jgi:hypothetical protein
LIFFLGARAGETRDHSRVTPIFSATSHNLTSHFWTLKKKKIGAQKHGLSPLVIAEIKIRKIMMDNNNM